MTPRAAGRQSRLWRMQVVHISDPPITSPAALVKLAKLYFTSDKTIYTELRMSKIRNKWMKIQMKTPDEQGGLTCALCGRKGLQPECRNKNNHNLATLDHILELQYGGKWNDPANFQVACYSCNGHKSNLPKQVA